LDANTWTRKREVVILELPSVSGFRTSRYVALSSGKDIRKMPATQIEIRIVRPAVVTRIGRCIEQTLLPTENPVPATYFEGVWELKSQTNSWNEDCHQCSYPTQTQNQPHHPPCSKQTLSGTLTIWLSQTATTISTSMCLYFFALPPGYLQSSTCPLVPDMIAR